MLVLISLFSCLSAFLFGYDLGLIEYSGGWDVVPVVGQVGIGEFLLLRHRGGALLLIRQDLHTSDGMDENIVGAAKLGAVLGSLIGAVLMQTFGRRPAIAADAGFFVLGPLVMSCSPTVAGLIAGRVLVGLGIGASAVVVPSYLGEVAPAKLRGRVVALYEVMLCVGMLAAALVDVAFEDVAHGWRWMVGIPALPALFMIVSCAFIPESPRWLVVQDRLEEALQVMHKIHTSVSLPTGVHASTADVEAELLELWSSVQKENSNNQANNNNGIFYNQRGGMPAPGGHTRVDYEHAHRDEGGQELSASVRGTKSPSSRPPNCVDGKQQSQEVFVTDTMPLLTASEHENDSSSVTCGKGTDLGTSSEFKESAGDHHGNSYVENAQLRAFSEDNISELTFHTRKPWYHGVLCFFVTLKHVLFDIYWVGTGQERRAFWLVIVLAFFNQACASTSILNYGPELLRENGLESPSYASLLAASAGLAKLVGVSISLLLVDTLGRRPLLLGGSLGCFISLLLLAIADWMSSIVFITIAMGFFVLFFSLSWAGVFWVILSEVFTMQSKAAAVAAGTASLFLFGSLVDFLFLTFRNVLGCFSFVLYAAIAALGGIFVFFCLPETRGKSLAEVQAILSRTPRPINSSGQSGTMVNH